MKLKYNEKVHGYWLDGSRCKGVTTLAKIPDNTFNLDKWRQRKLAVGLALRPDYVEVIAAHFDQDGTVDEYIDKAIEAAQASQGSNTGIAAHRVTQRRDTGETIIDTPLSAYIVKSWDEALERAGLEVVPEYIEACVVYPARKIAGRFDRYLRRKSDGRLVVADLKTGAKAIKFPHSMACQLGLYANAPLIARNIVADSKGDFETEDFEEAPDVDKEIAYIFHIPVDAEPMVAELDISAGWKAVERIIFPTLKWRDRGELCWPVGTPIVGGGESASVPPPVERTTPAGKSLGDMARARVKPTAVEELADPTAVAALQRRFDKLNGNAKAWVEAIVKQAHDAGHPISLANVASPSVRVFEIGRALVRFASLDPDDRLLWGALELLDWNGTVWPTMPLGDIVGVLTIQEAEVLNDIALAIHQGKRAVVYTDDGVQLPAA